MLEIITWVHYCQNERPIRLTIRTRLSKKTAGLNEQRFHSIKRLRTGSRNQGENKGWHVASGFPRGHFSASKSDF
jgi:hypothetical protein